MTTPRRALVFDRSRCVRCLRCVEACRRWRGRALTLNGVGTSAAIGFGPVGAKWAESSRCVACGQSRWCTRRGVVGKGSGRRASRLDRRSGGDDRRADGAGGAGPAGRSLRSRPGPTSKAASAALKALGVDFVMDTRWSADVTIMEEGTEVLRKLKADREAGRSGDLLHVLLPGLVNYVELSAPN